MIRVCKRSVENSPIGQELKQRPLQRSQKRLTLTKMPNEADKKPVSPEDEEDIEGVEEKDEDEKEET